MFKRLASSARKLLPTIVLVVLAVLAGATDVFSSMVREQVSKIFQEYAHKLLPFGINLLIGIIVVNFAYLLYHPLRDGLSRALNTSGASDRGKNLALKAMQVAYWGGAVFLALSIIAPDSLSKFFLGISLFGAALTLALQGAANDFICGVLLQFFPKFKVGDDITTIGLDVKGRVLDIGYLSTELESAEGKVVIPNREVWARAVKTLKPVKPVSPIILPPGVVLEKEKEEPKEEEKPGSPIKELLGVFRPDKP